MRKLLRIVLGFGVLALLNACIVVDDFGDYWNKGFIDNCVNEIASNDSDYDRASHHKTMLLRSLRIGKHTFLMMRDDMDDKGGNLIRYKIEDGEYISYRLNESKRDDFLREYPSSVVVLTQETATIPVLNSESAGLLSAVSDDDSYWVESHRETYNAGRRPDCIETLY